MTDRDSMRTTALRLAVVLAAAFDGWMWAAIPAGAAEVTGRTYEIVFAGDIPLTAFHMFEIYATDAGCRVTAEFTAGNKALTAACPGDIGTDLSAYPWVHSAREVTTWTAGLPMVDPGGPVQ